MRGSTKLKQLISTGKTYFIPGAYDGISARIIQNAGAEIIYATEVGLPVAPVSPTWGYIAEGNHR